MWWRPCLSLTPSALLSVLIYVRLQATHRECAACSFSRCILCANKHLRGAHRASPRIHAYIAYPLEILPFLLLLHFTFGMSDFYMPFHLRLQRLFAFAFSRILKLSYTIPAIFRASVFCKCVLQFTLLRSRLSLFSTSLVRKSRKTYSTPPVGTCVRSTALVFLCCRDRKLGVQKLRQFECLFYL